MDHYVWLPFRRILLPRCYHNKWQSWRVELRAMTLVCLLVTQSLHVCTNQKCVRIRDNQKTPFVNGLVFFFMSFARENSEAQTVKWKSKHVCLGSSCLEGLFRLTVLLIAEQMLKNITWQIIAWPQTPWLPKQTSKDCTTIQIASASRAPGHKPVEPQN